ncbi:MAG TPA: DUF3822 family protein [Bacteroidia bacterium]|jgi:hypothetical protein|nr:DUF3822 family protein [Bacteroidia bacterium]
MNAVARKLSPSLSLIDETADLKKAPDLVLHLLAGSGSLSLGVFQEPQHKFVALESYNLQNVFNTDTLTQTLRQIIESNTLLQGKYGKVCFAYDSHRSTLVPEALFEPGNAESYISFNHVPEKGELVLSDVLKNIDSRNIYLLPEKLKQLIEGFYPGAGFHHHSSALLESLSMRFRNETKPKLVLHVSLTHFEILFFEGRHLKFYNTFRHQTTEDFIYYLLFVCEQLKLNPENIDLILSGEVEKNSAIYAILYKYVRNIRFGERPDAFAYCHPMSNIPKHFYSNLFSQQLFQ